MSTATASPLLQPLLASQRLWLAGAGSTAPARGTPTGWPGLDAALPGGGWPAASLSEILLPAPGCGELQLLAPTLARLSRAGQRVVLVQPPALPFPATWRARGIDLSALHLLSAPDPQQALWAAEQCLRSGSCAAVLAWPQRSNWRQLRRLQVAADAGQALALALLPASHAAASSPAALRLQLLPGASGPRVRILKCRGGLPSDALHPLPSVAA